MRFIGKALEYLNAKGYDDRRLSLQVGPEFLHVGDLIRHPLFPGRNLYVVAREVDLIDRCVNVWIDELPAAAAHPDELQADGQTDLGGAPDSPFPASFPAIDD
jgi:hypothetical protein